MSPFWNAVVPLHPPSTYQQETEKVQMRSWQFEKFPEMSFKSKNKKRGKSIIQFVVQKTDYELKHSAEIRMSGLLSNSWNDGHVNVCKSFSWHSMMTVMFLINLIHNRELNVMIYIYKLIWCWGFGGLILKYCIFNSCLFSVWWLMWGKRLSMERTCLYLIKKFPKLKSLCLKKQKQKQIRA